MLRSITQLKIRGVSFTCAALLSALPIWAGELTSGDIPQDTDWFVHWNVEASRDSGLLSDVGEKDGQGKSSPLARWIEQRYGVDAKDLEGLTVYSSSRTNGDSTTALLYGAINEERMKTVVNNNSDPKTEEFKGVKIFTWQMDDKANDAEANNDASAPTANTRSAGVRVAGQTDAKNQIDARNQTDTKKMKKPKTLSVAFLDKVTAISPNKEAVKAAIENSMSKSSQASQSSEPLIKDMPSNAVVVGKFKDLTSTNKSLNGNGQKGKGSWEALEDVQDLSFAIGSTDSGKADVQVNLETKTEIAAERIQKIVEGLQALAAMSDTDIDLDGIKPEMVQNGSTLKISMKIDADQLGNMIDRQLERTSAKQKNPAVRKGVKTNQ